MGRTVPSADPSTVWPADLIEAAELMYGHRLIRR